MTTSIGNWLQHGLRAFLLRGSGWKSRTSVLFGRPRTEWRDPISGNWYGTRKALDILNYQMIAHYQPATATISHRFSLRC